MVNLKRNQCRSESTRSPYPGIIRKLLSSLLKDTLSFQNVDAMDNPTSVTPIRQETFAGKVLRNLLERHATTQMTSEEIIHFKMYS